MTDEAPATPAASTEAPVEATTTPVPEPEAPAVEDTRFTEAVKALVRHVRDGRRAGDADVEAALSAVERHL